MVKAFTIKSSEISSIQLCNDSDSDSDNDSDNDNDNIIDSESVPIIDSSSLLVESIPTSENIIDSESVPTS